MILQDRDVEIFKFINKFAFVNTLQISKMFDLSKSRTSQILSRLEKHGYLNKEQVLAKEPVICSITKQSADLIESKKPKPITLQNLKHNLLLVDVYIHLKLENPNLNLKIKSDRDLRKGKGFGYKGHIPDLLIETDQYGNKKDIAIELELSRKDIKRMKTVLSNLSRQNYVEVHYYCNGSTYNQTSRLTKLLSGFKVFNFFEDTLASIEPIIADIQSKDVSKSKDLEILIRKQTNDISLLSDRVSQEEAKVQKIIDSFEKLEFKKATFGNTYSVSCDDLTKFKNAIRGL
jgi:Mn-dependent DtxR family transcriptional regulator